jgi:hypothetical protein
MYAVEDGMTAFLSQWAVRASERMMPWQNASYLQSKLCTGIECSIFTALHHQTRHSIHPWLLIQNPGHMYDVHCVP